MVITLTSDMGYKDHYLASVKAALHNKCGHATVFDISHDIEPFNIAQTAFILSSVCYDFPEGTVHIIGVLPELTPENTHVLVEHNGHFFVGADNGIFSLLFANEPEKIYEITLNKIYENLTFPLKDVFVDVAAHIMNGGVPDVIGRRISGLKKINAFKPITDENLIKGQVQHIDSYGNVISNISKSLFEKVGRGRAINISYGNSLHTIKKIRNLYSDASEGNVVALFGSSHFLEISICKGVEGKGGSASSLLGLRINDDIRIEFS